MSNLLQELGPHGTLLLYLADELSPEDRAEVERRLLADPELRAELESLREAQALADSRLAALYAATPVDEGAAVRNVSRALRQWQARPRVAAPAGAADAGPRRFPPWAYPVAVAAAVALVAGVTWKALEPAPRDQLVDRPPPGVVEPEVAQLDPWEAQVVEALSKEVADAPPGEGQELASAGYDQPLFDIPFNVPPEGGAVEP